MFKDNNLKYIINVRIKIIYFFTFLVFLIVIIRLFTIQIINNKKYIELYDLKNNKFIYGTTAPRGRIYDRNGVLIVDNKPNKIIVYKKDGNTTSSEEIEKAYEILKIIDVDISKLTNDMKKIFYLKKNYKLISSRIRSMEYKSLKERKMTSEDLNKIMLERITEDEIKSLNELDLKAAYIYYLMNNGYSYMEKIIKNQDVSEVEYALVANSNIKGFKVKLDWQREYLYGDTFRSILGNVSSITEDNKEYYLSKGYSLNDRVGISYLEYQYDDYLKGTKNVYKIVNGDTKLIEEGSRGNDLFLTIDILLQQEIENIVIEEMRKAKKEPNTEYYNKSFVVVSNPNTGEILAMVGKQIEMSENGYIIVKDYTPGVINSSVTVGSVIKGASHIVGYNTGSLKIEEVRNDICVKLKATNLKCSWTSLGTVNDITALKKSSNTYQFYTAMKVAGYNYVYNGSFKISNKAFDTYRNTFNEFGLGVLTGIDIPLETVGVIGKSITPGLLLDFSIGQYDTYTPLQLNQYVSTIANGGNRMKMQLLKEVKSSINSSLIFKYKPIILNTLNTKEEYLKRVKEGFKEVLKSGGTGYGYINNIYKGAGKTGTSESFADINNDGKIDTETISHTFVAYAPYDNPTVSFTFVSPDIYNYINNSSYKSYVNKRIVTRVTNKYFEMYGF